MKVIIDTDPGTDDAIAIWLALASPEIEVIALTTVCGNIGIDNATRNARAIVAFCGRDVPVFAGAARPLLRVPKPAPAIHGDDGLMGVDLTKPCGGERSEHAVDHLRAVLRQASPGEVTVIAIGPLTNIALALRTEPAIARGLARIVLMGGAIGLGNVTPAAEFNIHADPHAAAIVFAAGVPVTMVPLDLTHQTIATPARRAALRALGNPVARKAAEIMDTYPPLAKFDGQGPPMHDPCAVVAVIAPHLMHGRDCHVAIDTGDGPSTGRTIVDWWGKGPTSARVLDRVDADGFFALMIERFARYGRLA